MAYIDNVTNILQIQPDGLPTFVRLSQNENGRNLYFQLAGNEVDIPANSTITISGTKPDGTVYSGTGSISDNVILIPEMIQMTAVAGYWDAKVKIISGGNTIATGRIRFVIDADTVDPDSVPSSSELEGLVAEAQQYAETARTEAYGSPLTAQTAAGMTDHTRVYVYTGSETGYTAGHWYYWDGTQWADGGIYNSTAVNTDPTLTLAGVAADAKATGDAIEAAQVTIDDTLTNEGEAADAKVVGDELSDLRADLSGLDAEISEKASIKDSTETTPDLDITDAYGNVLVRFSGGHIKTKEFDSADNITGLVNLRDTDAENVDLDIVDRGGNVLMRLKNGHIKTENFDSENVEIGLCYVSTAGLDSNDGSSSYPFATIQHAIDAGFTRIMVAPGEYKDQKVTIDGKHGISIICNTSVKENNLFESHKRQARAKLDNSIDVSGFVAYNSIYRTELDVDEDSSYYKVFVSQEVDPVYSGLAYYGRVTTYNAILWEITDDILTCTRLVPKLTLSECENTAGTFFYDGDYLYVHPTNGSLTGVSYKRLNDDTFTSLTRGFYVHNSTDIYIEGLDIQYFPYYDFHANLVSGLVMRDCGFYFTCYGSAAEYMNCNGDMWECNAAKAGADGFGIASGGNTSFYNCNAVYCYDDGISHHDESTGIIDGGIWTYCKKGGVTPSYGSHVTVKNVIATHNVYGIYWPQSEERVTDGVQYMQNCLAVDNTTKDIKITGYSVVAHGCSYGTKEVDTGASLAEYSCAVIS